MVEFTTSPEDFSVIMQITDRGGSLYERVGDKRIALAMDLSACHVKCPLDLAGLLQAGTIDFVHDVLGIRRHIDRETGHLQDGFVPRCARH